MVSRLVLTLWYSRVPLPDLVAPPDWAAGSEGGKWPGSAVRSNVCMCVGGGVGIHVALYKDREGTVYMGETEGLKQN